MLSFFNKKKYTKQNIEMLGNIELKPANKQMSDLACSKYGKCEVFVLESATTDWLTQSNDLRVYVFNSDQAADQAFKKLKLNEFRSIDDESSNYVVGSPFVYDMIYQLFVYNANNIIISCANYKIGSPMRDADLDEQPTEQLIQELNDKAKMLNTKIMRIWPAE